MEWGTIHTDDNENERMTVQDVETKAMVEKEGEPNPQNEHEDGGEEEYVAKEPNESRANSLKFGDLCRRMEVLWKQRKKSVGGGGIGFGAATLEQRLMYLLPSKLKTYLGDDGSPYPILRLIVPEIDYSGRPHLGIKEKTLAILYASAMGFSSEGHQGYRKLVYYTDPAAAGPTAVGDLSLAIYETVKERFGGGISSSDSSSSCSSKTSRLTVGGANDLLDELVAVKRGTGTSGSTYRHDWRSSQSQVSSTTRADRSFASKQEQRLLWVEKLFRIGLSPLEHKWMVRIVLQKLEIGIGWKKILKYYHPMAEELYASHTSLKTLCRNLSDLEWVRRRVDRCHRQHDEDGEAELTPLYPVAPSEKAVLGHTLAPMLSRRTAFDMAVFDMESRHLKRREEEEKKRHTKIEEEQGSNDDASFCLPAFICEEKVDGERMVVHVCRGVVTMHTRQGTWYSNAYTPVVGPAIRRAVCGRYDVDVILDGEMCSWDNGNQEVVAFGYNRTVAAARRRWLRRTRRQVLEERDWNLHTTNDNNDSDGDRKWLDVKEDEQIHASKQKDNNDDDDDMGSQCWLLYVVFDVLFVGGPDADILCREINDGDDHKRHHDVVSSIAAGSLLKCPLHRRKSILYRLLVPQINEVVHVEARVILSKEPSPSLPSSYLVEPKQFFTRMYHDGSSSLTLSTSKHKNPHSRRIIPAITTERQQEQEEERANAVDRFYSDLVMDSCAEGLVFKDLGSPYIPGERSRGIGYWTKLKRDYALRCNTNDVENDQGTEEIQTKDDSKNRHLKEHVASDLDVVILGGSFATGMSRAGLLTKFLVGVVDRNHDDGNGDVKYLPLCRVYSGHSNRSTIDRVLQYTGYTNNDNEEGYGNWFRPPHYIKIVPIPDDDNKSNNTRNKKKDLFWPDFLSPRSYLRSIHGDYNDGSDDEGATSETYKNGSEEVDRRCGGRRLAWSLPRKDYPDLWIHPSESIVLTIDAGEIVSSDVFPGGITLRFPRIVRVRLDEGYKPAQECETVQHIQNLYLMNQQKRRENGRSVMALSSYNDMNNRRFMTTSEFQQEQESLKKKQRRRTKRRRLQRESSLSTTTTTTRESDTLVGITVCVLEGRYDGRQVPTNDRMAGIEEGWYDEASRLVRDRKDVMDFVRRHGGTCHVAARPDDVVLIGVNDDMIQQQRGDDRNITKNKAPEGDERSSFWVVGGRTVDVRVQTYSRHGSGVLKWTALWSTVFRHRYELDKYQSTSTSTTRNNVKILRPRRHDYLVLSDEAEQALRMVENKFGDDLLEPTTMADFRRVMDEVGRQKRRELREEEYQKHYSSSIQKVALRWQNFGSIPLKASELWILGGRRQHLFPYYRRICYSNDAHHQHDLDNDSAVVMYPHVYGPDFGRGAVTAGDNGATFRSSCRERDAIGEIATCLALARCMGAQITHHLHRDVTHILCEMPEFHRTYYEWKEKENCGTIPITHHAESMRARLQTLQKNTVVFTTATWIKNLWDGRTERARREAVH